VFLAGILLLGAGCLSACAPAISRQFREQIGTPPAFERLMAQPEEFQGREVILGGYVLETRNRADESLVTVLQAPLDFLNRPKGKDLSRGRFLVRTDTFLDPEIYEKGRELTVGGRVSGVRNQPLGDGTYPYPVIEAVELHLWPEETPSVWPHPPYYDYGYYHPWYYHRWHRYPYFLRYPW
jgi:outer membrane lipoprotein